MFAHDEVRVIGTVMKKQDTAIQVKTAAGKTFSIAINKETKISRDKKKADATELKTGVSVVVDALATVKTIWLPRKCESYLRSRPRPLNPNKCLTCASVHCWR